MPKIIHALICDDIRIEAGTGKQILIGLFDRFNVNGLPSASPPFAMFCVIAMDDHESHALKVDLESPGRDPEELFTAKIQAAADLKPAFETPTFRMDLKLRGLAFSAPGRYAFAIHLDATRLGEIRFLVSQPEFHDPRTDTTLAPKISPSEPQQPS